MASRAERLAALRDRIGERSLVWFGVRGIDAAPLLDLPQFDACLSVIAPLRALTVGTDVCLEELSGVRVDLDAYTLDGDATDAARRLREALFHALSRPAVVVPYRPLRVFAGIHFPRRSFVEHLGLFHEKHAPFDHKPWVETELARAGARTIPWEYFGIDDAVRLRERLRRGAHVLRTVRSDGGAGLHLVRDGEGLPSEPPWGPDGFVAVAPFLDPAVSLNVNAVVFAGGSVSMHGVSVQFVGEPRLTRRRFGYCGNDFGAGARLDAGVLDEVDRLVRAVARWLAGQGFRGAFGVDALVHDGVVLLTELNPRFQGSSALAARLDRMADRSDQFLEHMAAFFGFDPPPLVALREVVPHQPRLAQAIAHNLAATPVAVRPSPESERCEAQGVPSPRVVVAPDAAMVRWVRPSGSLHADGDPWPVPSTAAWPEGGDVLADATCRRSHALPRT